MQILIRKNDGTQCTMLESQCSVERAKELSIAIGFKKTQRAETGWGDLG